MTNKELEIFLKEHGVESKMNIAQPWILWRAKTSLISLTELAEIVEESKIHENSNDG